MYKPLKTVLVGPFGRMGRIRSDLSKNSKKLKFTSFVETIKS